MTEQKHLTIDTLETHFSAQISHLKDLIAMQDDRSKERVIAAGHAVTMALAAADKALMKAETAIEKRFDGVNEFRATLSDQAAEFLPRAEYYARHESLAAKVDENSKRILGLDAAGKGRNAGIGSIGTVVLGVASVLSMLGTLGATILLIAKFTH